MSINSIDVTDSEVLALSQAWYNDVADLASDNKLTKREISTISLGKRQNLMRDISKVDLAEKTRKDLSTLLEELATIPVIVPPPVVLRQQKEREQQKEVISDTDLPLAPVTTFNVIRLIQLGYIPLEKPGKLVSPKWVFYGANVGVQWGNGKVNEWALNWSDSKGGSAYRAMLDKDISQLNDEIKGYQKDTKNIFAVKPELEKQLALLESLKTERDPKKILEIGNEYIASRSRTHFTPGAVSYTEPASPKTIAVLDAEITKAENRTKATEDRIKAREKDLAALKTKWEKDSTGKVGITKEEIEAQNKKRTEKARGLSDRNIASIEKQLVDKQAEVIKFQQEFDAAKQSIIRLSSSLDAVNLTLKGRSVDQISADINAALNASKINQKHIDELKKELRDTNQKVAYENELKKLWSLDHRGNPIPTPPATSVVCSAFDDLEKAKSQAKTLEWDLKKARTNQEKRLKATNKKGESNLNDHQKEIARREKHIQASKDILVKRREAEQKVIEINTKIKGIEAKLANFPTPSEKMSLETERKNLYAEKNAAAIALETALKSNNGRNDQQTQAAVEWQSKEVQKEIDKLNQLSAEMNEVKAKIDAIQAEVEVAKNALNNEKDPAKAKVLRDEMPAKINAANAQILELNNAGAKICANAGINWKMIPDVQLKSVLQRNLVLASFLSLPQWLVARAESFGQTPGGQKTMKVVYGWLRYVAVAGAARAVGNEIAAGDMKAAGLDALDAGMGFIGFVPGLNIASGLYDIGMAGKQFITGTDINGRKVSTTQSFVRLGFGIVGLVPVVGNITKGVAAARWATKAVSAVEGVERWASVAMKTATVGQVATITYDVVDVTANMVRDPVNTAMRVLKWQEQPWIYFTKDDSPK